MREIEIEKSCHSHQLLKKMCGAVSTTKTGEFSEIWGADFLNYDKKGVIPRDK